MITGYDKFFASLIPMILFLLNKAFGWEVDLSPEMQATIVGGLTSLLVWLVPNKSPAPAT